MNKKIIKIVLSSIILGLFFYWQNNSIVVNQIKYQNSKIADEFIDYKIVHISDLHNKEFGKNQKRLLKKIRETSPDIIVVTGDLIDRRRYNLSIARDFISGAREIASIYYVPGNHEAWSGKYEDIKGELSSLGVEILDNRKLDLIKNGERMEILGLSDPAFLTRSYKDGTDTYDLQENLAHMADKSSFQILLSHRPEEFSIYADERIDLIFSGHAHGGQFRIPFLGGLVAPNQGFFPKYTSGPYKEEDSTMIVSRGLGNSIVPIRIFNRPEIIVVTLAN